MNREHEARERDRIDELVARTIAALPKNLQNADHVSGVRNADVALLTIKLPQKQKKPAKRIGYRECVEYIGCNDDESMLRDGDPSVVVSMVAHLFDKETDTVIADVLRWLEKHDD